MRGVKMTELNIEALVSSNLRINGKVYSIDDALATFPNNRKQIQYSAERALYYHSMAKRQIGISWVDTVLSNL